MDQLGLGPILDGLGLGLGEFGWLALCLAGFGGRALGLAGLWWRALGLAGLWWRAFGVAGLGLGQDSFGPDLLHPEGRPLDQGQAFPLEGLLETPSRTRLGLQNHAWLGRGTLLCSGWVFLLR